MTGRGLGVDPLFQDRDLLRERRAFSLATVQRAAAAAGFQVYREQVDFAGAAGPQRQAGAAPHRVT